MTTDKPTYQEVYAVLMQKYKSQVCKLLQWDEMKYAEYQYKAGIAYLLWYLPCDEKARQQLERSKLYWNWFKTCWTEHDYAYVTSEGIDKLCLHERLRIYEALHCPRALAVEITPNRIVLDSIKKKQPVV